MRALALTLALLAAAVAPGQKQSQKSPTSDRPAQNPVVFWTMSRPFVDSLLNRVPQTDALRLGLLKQVFENLECRGAHLRAQSFDGGTNMICTLPGTAPEKSPDFGTILFVTHYEHVGSGQSAIENWTGAITLPFLYHALAVTPRHHTFLFAEVDGEAGGKALFDSFTPEKRGGLKAVVAVDALGLGPAQYFINPNDSGFLSFRLDQLAQGCGWSALCRVLLQASAYAHMDPPGYGIPGAWFKIDDTREFRHHKIPSILIQSVEWSARSVPGSERDTVSAIDHDAYFNNLTLLDYFITDLDQPTPVVAQPAASGPRGGRRR